MAYVDVALKVQEFDSPFGEHCLQLTQHFLTIGTLRWGFKALPTPDVTSSKGVTTRPCWEAIHQLPEEWRLWHSFDPICPDAILDALRRWI
jgi:hypothetical protein